MQPFEITLDRTMIASASSDNEALARVDGHIRFVESDQLVEEDRVWYAVIDNLRHNVVCLARDLDEVAPAFPKIRVAFCPTTVEAEEAWTDSSVQVVVVRQTVFGPLEADGRSRSTTSQMTITREEGRWTISALSLYLALRGIR